ncbi:MAG: hypothetical protein Q8K26_04420, partial [Candidatus Gracilibacteria bacterium]|nr:hypothetical protein [Candidatus Gracilibacteria bacterium]
LYLSNGKLYFSNPPNAPIASSYEFLSSLSLNDNNFYPIYFERRDGEFTLSVGKTQALSGTINTTTPLGIMDIGSTSIYSLQWNDIIDNVKIYRLK